MKIEIDKQKVRALTPPYTSHLLNSYPNLMSGRYYNILYHLSNVLEGDVADVGTYRGLSALSMALNPRNRVVSIDILDRCDGEIKKMENIRFYYDGWQNHFEEISSCGLIFFDEEHQGEREKEFLKEILSSSFQGVLVFDDIHLNDDMNTFWNGITIPKHDLTEIGHVVGTGVVGVRTEVVVL
jgi:hypothetical protein